MILKSAVPTLFLIATIKPTPSCGFAPSQILLPSHQLTEIPSSLLTLNNAMERLHDPSTNPYGPLEHVYSLDDINEITFKVSTDEWMALGSAIAESILETILDVGQDVLKAMEEDERMKVEERIAMEVSKVVKETLHNMRYQPHLTEPSEQGTQPLPNTLLQPLQNLLRKQLESLLPTKSSQITRNSIVKQDNEQSKEKSYQSFLATKTKDLSLLTFFIVSEAIESYCGITNINAPFFDLTHEMNHRIADRRRKLLVKHSKGYENVKDVVKDIEESRKEWARNELGSEAADNFRFGEVMTKIVEGQEGCRGRGNRGNGRMKREKQSHFLDGLFEDLNGVLVP